MADIKIANANFYDVPAIDIPTIDGGIARFTEGSGGGLPVGVSALDYGTISVNTRFTTTRQTFNHKLGVVPDLMIVLAPTTITATYSMLCSIRSNLFAWRSGYSVHNLYRGNNSNTYTWAPSNSTTYGISNMTATTFQLASISTSYYWQVGTYKYIAIKF